jgi:hypothetical protein
MANSFLFEIQQHLPKEFHIILKIYLNKRYFFIKQRDAVIEICKIRSGIPQESVLGPLYLLFTTELPIDTIFPLLRLRTIRQYLQYTRTQHSVQISSKRLKPYTNLTEILAVNENKLVHVTFSTRTAICPAVYLNGTQIPQAKDVKWMFSHVP